MKARLQSIDLARGLVMALMALDHVRDYFSNFHFDPTELDKGPTSALFLTRWITHFCAPTFVLLAGVSAGIQRDRGQTRGQLARFLVTRGLWLIFLELTLVNLGWFFDPFFHFVGLQVIWVLGVSMILLAGLQLLPRVVLGPLALLVLLSHNLLDQVRGPEPWWSLLHHQGPIYRDESHFVMVIYPIIPWFAVMALGFVVAPVFSTWNSARRRRALALAGGLLVAGFTALRASRLYGDPQPFSVASDPAFTIWSFLNAQKYPPSLLYLAMTLGPLCLLLAAIDRAKVGERHPLLIFGRVPLFYYLLHVPLIHAVQVLIAALLGIKLAPAFILETKFGFPLGMVYLLWGMTLCALYPLCVWYAQKKATSRSPWLAYL